MKKQKEKKLISKIEHKYAIGQTIFYMVENKIRKAIIEKIIIIVFDLNKYSVEYSIGSIEQEGKNWRSGVVPTGSQQVNENQIFTTQDELINSIKIEQ